VRSVEDALYGPIVSFGVEGIASGVLHDWAYRIPPLTDVDAAEMLREIKAAPLLAGRPNGAEVDTGAVEELIQRVARLKHDLPEVEVLDLTPVLAGSSGVRTLGASARVAPVPEGRAESFVRRLTAAPMD
jgi:acyl-CoA synthetase (NDP forming)